ncbi:M23 family metallopeptidase [Ferruginibacter paludis]|uniref:M23 family metallopeptidase n=1 Tax=Ferruginibacter paludis TaxID=1310417 RepID=UPI0025B34AD4|nr:M23 family metallopeptidase [Ferruginibacter paludis]MDN3658283.1 M23 family metallopeptidase [Ferruginibacter paludis]
MNVHKLTALCLFLLIFISATAQIFPAKNYPQGYFQWPVIAKHALAANFGELRPNHYHMGLDCKTDQRENVPVVAAADGYIAKVKIEPFGFGRCIYINHPNGLTTLYAHLNDFYPALEKYITELQYEQQSWKVFVDIPEGMFPVKKGQQIAFSGNTGGSQGPHTHFEIRDTKTDKVLNPFLFGMGLPDNIPPDIFRVAMYDRCLSTYEQSPKFYNLKKENGIYTIPAVIITNTDKVSFAIAATDRFSGSPHKYGIYEASLSNDERPVIGFQIDSISYDETRYVNAQIDYKLRSDGGPFVQHLSRLPGYPEGIYKQVSGDGVIDLTDDSTHAIKIEVKDAAGNSSILKFNIKRGTSVQPKTMSGIAAAPSQTAFRPGFVNIFENEKICAYLPEPCLYDSFRFTYKEIIPATGFPVYQVHNASVPLQTKFSLMIKNSNAVYPDKMVMHRFANGKNDYAKAVHNDGWYTASFKAFGNFQLLQDTVPPAITPVGFWEGMNVAKLNRLAFVITDATEELQNFSAMLDGKWLRFSNDKGRTFIYKMDEHCGPGKHELKISVADCAGNTTEKWYHFSR